MAKDFDFYNLNTICTSDKLLIDGYLRTVNRSSFAIPRLVYKLCVVFRQSSAQHLWTVNPVTLHQMKNCMAGQRFVSPTFEIEYLSWHFDVFPKGSGTDRIGSFDILPVLSYIPSSWDSIECFIVIRCLETISTCFSWHGEVKKGAQYRWRKRAMIFSELDALESLSFSFEVHVQSISLKHSFRDVYCRDIRAIDQSVEWKIDRETLQKFKTAHEDKVISSPICGGMYCIILLKTNSNILFGLQLCGRTSHRNAIDILCTMDIMAKGNDFENVCKHSVVMTLSESVGWMTKEYLSLIDLLRSKSLSFKIDIKEQREKDNVEDRAAINYWRNKIRRDRKRRSEGKQQEKVPNALDRIKSLESFKESTMVQTAEILAMVTQLRVEIAVLKDTKQNQERTEPEKLDLQTWLEHDVKLPQYVELLMDNGFEDMESMKYITMDHLREMGIEKMGHRLKLMKSVAKLKALDD